MTRPFTPHEQLPDGKMRLHVKRCCEKCGREIGDVRPEELEAAIAGHRLPNVADECGCPVTIEQLAQFMNARDHNESGTQFWQDLDDIGRESYVKDATAIVRAFVLLGWAPKPTDQVTEPTHQPEGEPA